MKISITGIIAGFVIDLLGTITSMVWLGIVLGFIISYVLAEQGYQGVALEQKVMAIAYGEPVMIFALFVGWFCTFVGGFFAAKMAGGRSPFINSGIVGIIAVGLSIGADHLGYQEGPRWIHIVGLVGSVPVALLGGWVIRAIAREYEKAEAAAD